MSLSFDLIGVLCGKAGGSEMDPAQERYAIVGADGLWDALILLVDAPQRR